MKRKCRQRNFDVQRHLSVSNSNNCFCMYLHITAAAGESAAYNDNIAHMVTFENYKSKTMDACNTAI